MISHSPSVLVAIEISKGLKNVQLSISHRWVKLPVRLRAHLRALVMGILPWYLTQYQQTGPISPVDVPQLNFVLCDLFHKPILLTQDTLFANFGVRISQLLYSLLILYSRIAFFCSPKPISKCVGPVS